MDAFRVSVIMPCHNCAGLVERGIRSVLDQTARDLELIVVENVCSDNSSAVVKEFQDDRIRLVSEPRKGVSKARNRGLQIAKGSLIAFLDADDTWDPTFLEKMCSALDAAPGAALVYCGWQNVGLPGARGEPFVPPEYERPDKFSALLEGCRWPIHAVLTRRGALEASGGFDTRLTIGEDYLLWLEAAAQGALVRVPEVLAQYHHHGGDQATRNRALSAIDTLRAKQFFLQRHPDVAVSLGSAVVESHTWGKLIQEGKALQWQGDLPSARKVFRKALFAGRGTLPEKLRMLPSVLPLGVHRAILRVKSQLNG